MTLINDFVTARAASSSLLRSALAGDAAVLAHPEVGGNALKLLVDNTQFRPSLIADIQGAKSVINAQEFIWTNDGLGKEVADLLKQKAAEGVEVNMSIDGTGSSGFPYGLHPAIAGPGYRHFVADMREAGVNVIENWRFGGKLREGAQASWDHRKIFTIDGKVAYLGGINLSQEFEHWHDVMVRMEGPVAAQVGAEYLGRWVDLGGAVSDRHAQTLADAQQGVRQLGGGGSVVSESPGTARARVITNSPGPVRELTSAYLEEMRRPSSRLWVTTPSLASPEAVQALKDAHAAGTDVRVIIPSFAARDGDAVTRAITSTYVDELVAARVKVYELPRTIHAKVLLTDHTATISSFNLNMRSHTKDMESGVPTPDQGFRDDVEAMLRADFATARPVTLADGHTALRQAVRGVREMFGLTF